MRPQQIAKPNSESAHQKAFFTFCAIAAKWGIQSAIDWLQGGRLPALPDSPQFHPLLWIHHIPNGGSRGDNRKSAQIRGAKLKAEGLTKGIFDVHFPYPTEYHPGLYIEFKDPKLKPKTERSRGGLKQEQMDFGTYAYEMGYDVQIAYSYIQAIIFLLDYLGFKHNLTI